VATGSPAETSSRGADLHRALTRPRPAATIAS
jgi:hypothetical protein